MTDSDRRRRALESFRKHGGRDFVFQRAAHDPPSVEEIALLGLDSTYGEAWCRPELDLRTRSFIVMTAVAVQGCEGQLYSHIAAAHNAGVTKDEVIEWLIQLIGYIGVPLTNNALAVARAVWKDTAENKPMTG